MDSKNYFESSGKNILIGLCIAIIIAIILPFICSQSIYMFFTPCSSCNIISGASWFASLCTIILMYLILTPVFLIMFHIKGNEIIKTNEEIEAKNFLYSTGKLIHKIALYLAGIFILSSLILICLIIFG